MREVERDLAERAAAADRAANAPPTFRDVARAYVRWLEQVHGAKPATLREHRYLLVEPGTRHRRGTGSFQGLIMKSFGDRAAEEVTTRDVNAMLAQLAATGLAPRTVNKSRQLVCAIYNYGCREATFGLARNPATAADRRPEPECRGRSPSDLGRYHFQSPRSFMVAGNTATTTGAAVVTTPAVALIPRTTASAMRMPRSKASRMPLSSR